MSEQKSLTLNEAKGRMEHIRRVAIEYNDLPRINCATDCIDLLARVEMPSEEDMAVLWLIREKSWNCFYDERNGWYELEKGHYFNPTEEARKLGWKP